MSFPKICQGFNGKLMQKQYKLRKESWLGISRFPNAAFVRHPYVCWYPVNLFPNISQNPREPIEFITLGIGRKSWRTWFSYLEQMPPARQNDADSQCWKPMQAGSKKHANFTNPKPRIWNKSHHCYSEKPIGNQGSQNHYVWKRSFHNRRFFPDTPYVRWYF